RDLAVEQCGVRGRGPGGRVDAVGYRMHVEARVHGRGNLAMTTGNAVNVAGEEQTQVCHVEHAFVGDRQALDRLENARVEHGAYEVEAEAVVPRRDRRVCGEGATGADDGVLVLACRFDAAAAAGFVEQRQGQERAVPLVHVEGLELAITERLEHRRAADTEQRFLAETVTLVATVQVTGESAVL